MERNAAIRVDQHTALYGVVGNPVRHSLSPALHNAAFAAMGLNAVYLAFEPADIEGCVKGIRTLGIRGTSVTIPFKATVIPHLSRMDPLAERIGAVNTIINQDGILTGYNTDAVGALKALEEVTKVPGKRCILVGAGGAARAVGFILKEQGAALTVVNRSWDTGQRLARFLGCNFSPLKEMASVKGDILIQTTPVGMWPHKDQSPVPEPVLEEGMVVMDLVYHPLETRLLSAARARGCTLISGIRMLIHQGAEQFRLWTGIDPPLSIMEGALREALTRPHGHH